MRMFSYPEDFTLTDCIDSCRFWLMLKLKFKTSYWDKKYEMFLNELTEYLKTFIPQPSLVRIELEKIQLSSYRTISETFYQNRIAR